LDLEKVAKLVAISKITEDGARTYLALAGDDVRRAVHDVALETEEAISILKTELKKDERARDLRRWDTLPSSSLRSTIAR
jgi:hypothetical protein